MSRIRRQALLLALIVAGHAFAASNGVEAEFSSGKQRVALIELFTSEGCSSCPPADQWLRSLKVDPGLWKEFAPIAFHVDYWDYIGWSDRFAQAGFSDRQRRYADEGGARVVYTPGFFRNGQEWRGWQSGTALADDEREAGELRVRISNQVVEVQFDSGGENREELVFHLAVLGMNLETRVRAGENNGRTLRHDFVALGIVSVPFGRAGTGYQAIAQLPEISLIPGDRAMVAWVSGDKKQAPIQSVGGFLPNR